MNPGKVMLAYPESSVGTRAGSEEKEGGEGSVRIHKLADIHG